MSASGAKQPHGAAEGYFGMGYPRSDEETSMPTGTLKWYNPEKGFGFLTPDKGGTDVFVHVSAVEAAGHGDPLEGDRLSYDVEESRDGRASAVRLRKAET